MRRRCKPVLIWPTEMSNVVGAILLVGFALGVILVALCEPALLSDNNSFLKNFVNHEFLNILGVIVAITAASASSVHLELRRLEADYNFKNGFENTRKEVKRGAFSLLVLFGLGVILVVIKPLISLEQPKVEALLNGFSLFILFWNILVLWSLLELSFKVGPVSLDDDDDGV